MRKGRAKTQSELPSTKVELGFSATLSIQTRRIMPQRQLVRAIRSSPCAFIELPPLFLAPALQTPFRASIERCSAFSTATALSYPRRDKNKSRGVSAIRMTGPKHKLAAMKYPLPQPVLNPTRRSKAATNDNHGLWQFFPDSKMAMATPEEEFAFGEGLNP